MDYLLSFLEGILTFISPCLLPMLPIYVFYFTGDSGEERATVASLRNALGFVLGFTLVFVAMGALGSAVGGLLVRYQAAFNLAAGGVVVLFGLHYLGIFPSLRLFSGGQARQVKITGFFSALLFGLVFSVSWTPCVGALLGSALLLASQQGSVAHGVLMLLCYSAGLGIPFLISTVLIDRLKGAVGWVKAHYRLITRVSGGFLILMGVLMATGLMGRLLGYLAM